ncbi:unnamed protein product [Adineta steineri]|uniref:G-protein coupled receptors family 1 profile domain-containing protein n=1 Tax=Adineta steineri TaxID=433720 RepID=A0A813WJF0_9BILA|nr:unnamed protein product [Adineta steineri]CAF0858312.1 unnamed protein product [Adineta steineri]CAF0918826.1 unnamed protein product [Adineta steineri]
MAFTIDWSSVIIYYCQIRSFFSSTGTFGAIIILCLAIIDQYFATCTRIRRQRWSNIKVAHCLTLIVSIILTAQGVLYSIYFRQISPVNTAICISVNHNFLLYHTYGYFLVLGNLFPLIAVIFGIMAYRNARTLTTRVNPLVRRELDKQLTIMVLVEICVYVCTQIPYSITNGFISLSTDHDPVFVAQFNLINAITLTINILSNGNSFYTYFCVSKRFRRQAKYVLYDFYINHNRQNQVHPNQPEGLAINDIE